MRLSRRKYSPRESQMEIERIDRVGAKKKRVDHDTAAGLVESYRFRRNE